ncbi:Hypothetical predicted protein, partial [Mytilus galloprovincialis]
MVIGAFAETAITAMRIPKHRNCNAIVHVEGNHIECVAGLREMPSIKFDFVGKETRTAYYR